MPTSELVKVSVTPQGTADVYIGELHIKTFGGVSAHQAASDFAAAIRAEVNKLPNEPALTMAEILDKGDNTDVYKTRKPR